MSEEQIIRLQQLNDKKQAIYRHSLDIIGEGYRKGYSLKQIVERLFKNKLGITDWGLEKTLKIKILKLHLLKLETASYASEASAMVFSELVREDAAELTELQDNDDDNDNGNGTASGKRIRKRKKRTRKRKKSRRCKGKRCKKRRKGTKKR